MKKTLTSTLWLAAMAAHARYEDTMPGDPPPVLDEGNLLPYTLIALAIWAVAVWSGGWRKRSVPLALAVAAFGVATVWGPAGSGAFVLLVVVGLIAYGVARRR